MGRRRTPNWWYPGNLGSGERLFSHKVLVLGADDDDEATIVGFLFLPLPFTKVDPRQNTNKKLLYEARMTRFPTGPFLLSNLK